jgi:hypothetical protein
MRNIKFENHLGAEAQGWRVAWGAKYPCASSECRNRLVVVVGPQRSPKYRQRKSVNQRYSFSTELVHCFGYSRFLSILSTNQFKLTQTELKINLTTFNVRSLLCGTGIGLWLTSPCVLIYSSLINLEVTYSWTYLNILQYRTLYVMTLPACEVRLIPTPLPVCSPRILKFCVPTELSVCLTYKFCMKDFNMLRTQTWRLH